MQIVEVKVEVKVKMTAARLTPHAARRIPHTANIYEILNIIVLPERHLFVILPDILDRDHFWLLLPGNKYYGIIIDIRYQLLSHWNSF